MKSILYKNTVNVTQEEIMDFIKKHQFPSIFINPMSKFFLNNNGADVTNFIISSVHGNTFKIKKLLYINKHTKNNTINNIEIPNKLNMWHVNKELKKAKPHLSNFIIFAKTETGYIAISTDHYKRNIRPSIWHIENSGAIEYIMETEPFLYYAGCTDIRMTKVKLAKIFTSMRIPKTEFSLNTEKNNSICCLKTKSGPFTKWLVYEKINNEKLLMKEFYYESAATWHAYELMIKRIQRQKKIAICEN